ncbi:TetR/AcrR family transcriptional regulator [Sphingomonas crocodyli]|uniref:TetR/AcrR family transcriptional regulator n=1 Tax=Sphingomonas crocodyli TaxID=1979270 RepID=A0A437M167_9SPHN|nr:TetR/AcrR family transcriptional regulator [Sphingomonas crocodyli]
MSPPARSGGRAAFLEAQRQRTRAAIIAGARTLFSGTPYLRATVEDILEAASVSRATFYQHFDSKTALAFAIYDEMRPEVRAQFDAIADIDPADEGAVRGWLENYVALYVRHRYVTSLLAQLQLFEPSFRATLHKDRDAFIDRLSAAGIAGFTDTKGDGAALERRVRARLMFHRLTFTASEVAQDDALSPGEKRAYVDATAADFRAFLRADKPA